MTAFQQASSAVTQQIEVEFPNLFGGVEISYYRGFEIFGVPIYWYGVIITVGVCLAYFYAMRRSKEVGLNKDRVFDAVFAALIGGFLGARIYYCVFQTLDPNSGIDYNFVTMFTTIRDGGLAIYGGIIGGFLVGFVASRIRKVHFLALADIAAPSFLIGQTIGRWGNFINQEAHGGVCDPDWIFGMTGTIISAEVEKGALVHPCFLYESAWCLLGFLVLHFYSKALRTFDGEIALLYIAWYGAGRFFIEGLRTDSLMAGEFKVSRLVAGASFVVAVILLIVFKIVTEKKQIPLYKDTEACKLLWEQDMAKQAAEEAKKAAKLQAPSILADDADEVSLDEPKPDEEAPDETEHEDNITQNDAEYADETDDTDDESEE